MRFRDLPIQRKLFTALFLTSLSVIALMGVAVLVFEHQSHQQSTQTALDYDAALIAPNATSALARHDKALAADTLRGLAATSVEGAQILLPSGELFASMPGDFKAPSRPTEAGSVRNGDHYTLMRPLAQGGQELGTLYLYAEAKPMVYHLADYSAVLMACVVPAAMVVLLLSAFFQRQIAGPLIELTGVARQISEQKDYTARARKTSNDELGLLTDTFNSMVEQIQASHLALRESESQLSAIFQQAGAGIAQADLEGRFTRVNDRYCEILGRTREAILGHNVTELTHPEDREANQALLQTVRLKGNPASITKRYLRGDGTAVWVRNSVVALRNPRGAVIATLAVVQDITDYMVASGRSRQMAAIVESTDDAIVSKDMNGVIQSWNPGAERLFGWTAEEAIGKSILLIVPKELHHEEPAILERIRRGERIDHYETVRVHKDGRRMNISITISPLKDASGKVSGASKIARDITKRKYEQEVLADRARLAALGVDVAQAISCPDQRAGLQAFAQSLSERIDASLVRIWVLEEHGQALELLASAGLPWPEARIERVRLDQLPIGLIARNKEALISNDIDNDPAVSSCPPPKGQGLVAFAGYPLMVEGLVVGVVAFFRRLPLSAVMGSDIMPLMDAMAQFIRRKTSENALLARESQLRFITDSAPVLLAHLDMNTRYLFANRPYAKRYGFEPGQLLGKYARDVVGAATYEKVLTRVDAVKLGHPVEFELRIDNPGPGARWTHAVYLPERSPSGQVVGFVAVHSDITQRKNSELELAKARDDALAASRAKDDFLAALSHELRTPLNPVLLLASDSAGNESLPEEVRGVFATIAKNVQLEARLIDDLLDLTRITRGKMSLDLEIVDAHTILQDAIGTLTAELEAKHITLDLALEATKHSIIGDLTRLQQVYWNLLKNALKFTPDGGRISVSTSTADSGDQLVITVKDTGIGMTPDEIDRAFLSFSQGNHAKAGSSHRFGGLGLGLAISRKLIELHSGSIEATSPGRDQGATFTVRLPLSPVSSKPGSGEAKVEAARPPPAIPGRILLVEDHAPTRLAIVQLLSRRNYKVAAAGSVAEALDLAGRQSFDYIVSDIGLPDGDGYELMTILKARHQLKGIALSGFGMEEDVARSTAAGFVAHLTKPVNVRTLESALAALHTDQA